MVCNCSNSTTTVLNCQIFAVLSERQTVNLEHAITCPELLNSCSVNKTASKKYGVMSCCPVKLRKKSQGVSITKKKLWHKKLWQAKDYYKI